MQILQRASQEFGAQIEPVIFGADLAELQQAQMPLDFPFKLAGRLGQSQVAALMNQVDIFVDFSTFQGLGLSALEAMSCGAAAIVPERGGTADFAIHEENCLAVDTQDSEACYAALQRLVIDHDLRHKLQQNGLLLTPQFYPEQPTFKMLQALWQSGIVTSESPSAVQQEEQP
jgi:glycosyltransferase involved in cell wall biosynthesis